MPSLHQRLNKIIRSIMEFSNSIEIISINASISASKMEDQEGRVFKVIASEIREISRKSLYELSDLDIVLKAFKSLTEIINIAGRQRMLIQKSMKIKLLMTLEIEDSAILHKELNDTFNLFEQSHDLLVKATMNDAEISDHLDQLQLDWNTYKNLLSDDSLKKSNDMNTVLVKKMNAIVTMYQDLS